MVFKVVQCPNFPCTLIFLLSISLSPCPRREFFLFTRLAFAPNVAAISEFSHPRWRRWYSEAYKTVWETFVRDKKDDGRGRDREREGKSWGKKRQTVWWTWMEKKREIVKNIWAMWFIPCTMKTWLDRCLSVGSFCALTETWSMQRYRIVFSFGIRPPFLVFLLQWLFAEYIRRLILDYTSHQRY